MVSARVCAGVSSVLMVVGLSGCSALTMCTDTTVERGRAGVEVQITDVDGNQVGVSARVVDWTLEPHPQTPTKGDLVHFHYRFGRDDMSQQPAVDVCAVDGKRVVLGCLTIYAAEATGAGFGDDWIYAANPEQVSAVLVIPNDQSYSGRTCAQDVKDGGGPHPPRAPEAGDRL